MPFSVQASVCAQHLVMRLQTSVCFRRICPERLDLMALPLLVAGTQLQGYHPKQNCSTKNVPCRQKTKILCFYTSGILLSRLLNSKLHFKTQSSCEDTDPRLVSFLSLPLFPQQDPMKKLEHSFPVDLHTVDCFNIQAEIWFVTVLMQKANLPCNSLG